MISHAAPSRVGVLGNPSDGYGGRTLALAVPAFTATVSLEEADGIEIVGLAHDEPTWASLDAMVDHLDRYGYRTGPQLLAATVRTFTDVAASLNTALDNTALDNTALNNTALDTGFRLSYRTTIPRQVGLGGSSALVVATLRCLCEHYELDIPKVVLPSIALRAETAQLGLTAGLQDRVVQTYGGLVAMDFSELEVNTRFGVSHGEYESVDERSLPPLFVAYRESAAGPSSSYHQELRARFESGDAVLRETLRELAGLVMEGRAALRWGDQDRFVDLIGRNMKLRVGLGPIPDAQLALVEVAESLGGQATFAGSGGAVVGAFTDGEPGFDSRFEALRDAYADIGADVVALTPSDDDSVDGDSADGDSAEDGSDTSNVVAFPTPK